MFDNAGSKLKTIATCTFILIAIGCVGLFIIGANAYRGGEIYIVGAIVLLILGYVSCLTLAAFGEIAKDVHTLAQNSSPSSILTESSKPTVDKTSSNDSAEDSVSEPISGWELGSRYEGKVIVNRKYQEVKCPFCDYVQPSSNDHCASCKVPFIEDPYSVS